MPSRLGNCVGGPIRNISKTREISPGLTSREVCSCSTHGFLPLVRCQFDAYGTERKTDSNDPDDTERVRAGSPCGRGDRQPEPAPEPRGELNLAAVQDRSAQVDAGYAGSETCLVCHFDHERLAAHGLTADPRTPMAGQGCESCHGPGLAHADSGGDTALIQNPAVMPPLEANATCTTCHNRDEQEFLEGSPHGQPESFVHQLPQRAHTGVARASARDGIGDGHL